MPEVDTRCPSCSNRVTVADPALCAQQPWYLPGEAAVACPVCDWEFVVDANGEVVDDGEPDGEPLLTIDADGTPESVDLLTVTCQRCGRAFETEPCELARCPSCRHQLSLPGGVPADEQQFPLTWHEGDCECDHCMYGDASGEEYVCPNCGSVFEEEDETLPPQFVLQPDGRVKCAVCHWVFRWPESAPQPQRPASAVVWSPGLTIEQREGAYRRTHVVARDGGAQFCTIGEALRTAYWGELILVRPGEYEESLIIDRPVELRADGPPGCVVVFSRSGPCVRVLTPHAEVHRIKFCQEAHPYPAPAIEVDGAALFEDCAITSCGHGVLVQSPQSIPLFRRCHIQGCGGVGLLVAGCALATLEDCEIVISAAAGVESITGGRLHLERCRVEYSRGPAVLLRSRGVATLLGCHLTAYRGVDLLVEYGADVFIENACATSPRDEEEADPPFLVPAP
jgi:hypothetical protein